MGLAAAMTHPAVSSVRRAVSLAVWNRSRSRPWQARALMTRTPEAFSRMMRTTVSTAVCAFV